MPPLLRYRVRGRCEGFDTVPPGVPGLWGKQGKEISMKTENKALPAAAAASPQPCEHRWTWLGNSDAWKYCALCRLPWDKYLQSNLTP